MVSRGREGVGSRIEGEGVGEGNRVGDVRFVCSKGYLFASLL